MQLWGYARQALALTDVAIRQAKPRPKQYKVADGEGLYLLVTPAGGKLWRLKYQLAGKEKLMAFGAYPEVSQADARKRRDEARQQLAASKDPSREKQRAKVRQVSLAKRTVALSYRVADISLRLPPPCSCCALQTHGRPAQNRHKSRSIQVPHVLLNLGNSGLPALKAFVPVVIYQALSLFAAGLQMLYDSIGQRVA